MQTNIFQDTKGEVFTFENIINKLKELGADKAKVLYVHSDIGFGKPLLKRKEYIKKLFEALNSLGVETLIFPTYTFSFCNNEDFDIDNSKTSMGILNEYARVQVNSYRTEDPLLSVCVIGNIPQEYSSLSNFSCGEGSSFEVMKKDDGHMFLFFGAKPTECFTFLHYVEAMYEVPYRYDKEFSGYVIKDGKKVKKSYNLFTLYDTVIPGVDISFQNNLEEKGILKKLPLGEKEIMLVKGKSVYEEAIRCFDKDINIILARPYDMFKLEKTYKYGNVDSIR